VNPLHPIADNGMLLLGLLLLSVTFAFITIKRKSLTVSGAVSAVLLGNGVIFLSGLSALIPLLIFFGGSHLISRWPMGKKSMSDFKSGKPRDAIQVFSNGGVYLACSLMDYLTGDSTFQNAMLASMAIATADTWSSEVGCRIQGKTYTFPTFKRTHPGISGGISLAGTLAGMAGAIIIGLYGWIQFSDLPLLFTLTATGVGGMFLDSLIGHYFQIKYLDLSTGTWKDHSTRYHATKGFRLITNDAANFWSNLIITSTFILVY